MIKRQALVLNFNLVVEAFETQVHIVIEQISRPICVP
jgi:hypothetical protein